MEPNERIKSGLIVTALSLSAMFAGFGGVFLKCPEAKAQSPNTPIMGGVAPAVPADDAKAAGKQLLLKSRRALAEGDIIGAERFVADVRALNLNYDRSDDRPEYVSQLIEMQVQNDLDLQRNGNTTRNRQVQAYLFNQQADGLYRSGELDLAESMAKKSLSLNVQFSEEAINSGKDPQSLLRKIADRKTQIRANHTASLSTERSGNGNSAAVQNQLKQINSMLQSAVNEMNAGNYKKAEEICNYVRKSGIPESSYPQDMLTPGRVLAEISKRRSFGTREIMPAGNTQQPIANNQNIVRADYDRNRDMTRMQPVQGESDFPMIPGTAPIIPAIPSASQSQPVNPAIEFRPATPMNSNDPRNTFAQQDAANRNLAAQIEAEVGQKISEAYREMDAQNPKKAMEIIDTTRANVESSEISQIQKAKMFESLNYAQNRLQGRWDANKVQYNLNEKNQAVWNQMQEERDNRDYRQMKLKELVDQCNALIAEHRFEEAVVVAGQAKEIAPNDAVANQLAITTKVMANLNIYNTNKTSREEGFLNAMHAVDRAAIAFDEKYGIMFGENWSKVRGRASLDTITDRQRSEIEMNIIRQLDTPITLDYADPQPIGLILDHIRTLSGCNLVVDQKVFEEEGITTNTMVPVSFSQPIPIRNILNILLSQLNLSYIIEDECLKITSAKYTQAKMVSKHYYVGDLVVKMNAMRFKNQNSAEAAHARGARLVNEKRNLNPSAGVPVMPNNDYTSVDMNPYSLAQIVSNTGNVRSGQGGGFGNVNPYGSNNGIDGLQGGGADFGQLIDLIEMVVKPGTWNSSGRSGTGGVGGVTDTDDGTQGSMLEYYNTLSLVVRHTEEAHNELADLLAQLRKLNDLQVTIEVRFITLADNYAERMGVNFAINIPNKAIGGGSRPGNDISIGLGSNSDLKYVVNQMKGPYDISMSQGSYEVGVPPGFSNYNAEAGTDLAFAILSQVETFFYINAAQQDIRSSILQAPKITLFNGSWGEIRDTTERYFVTGVEPVVGDFAAAYQPIITVLSEGNTLAVQAVVSNSRQHVKVVLNPNFTTISDTENTFRFYADDEETSEETSKTTGDPSNPSLGDENDNSKKTTTRRSGVSLQQPSTATVEIMTVVSVPDGGTILMGGIKRLQEGRNEAGTPFLDKVPFVKRLFTNTGVGRSTSSLMMMVTPRIIIQEEEEEFIMGTPPE